MALLGPHIIVGLGNPGREYDDTRHNAGFKVIDALAEELGVGYWKTAANALVGETTYKGEKLVLIKPQSFMNLSGGPVKGLTGRYGFSAADVLVIHDELDLPAGTIRLKFGGGHAGHNGLRSVHQSIGSEYARLRIGIGRPEGRMPPHTFVLQHLKRGEAEDFAVTIATAVPILLKAVEEGVERAMNEINRDKEKERKTTPAQQLEKPPAETIAPGRSPHLVVPVKGAACGDPNRLAESIAGDVAVRASQVTNPKEPIGMAEVVAAVEAVVKANEAAETAKAAETTDPSAPTEPLLRLDPDDRQ